MSEEIKVTLPYDRYKQLIDIETAVKEDAVIVFSGDENVDVYNSKGLEEKFQKNLKSLYEKSTILESKIRRLELDIERKEDELSEQQKRMMELGSKHREALKQNEMYFQEMKKRNNRVLPWF